MTRAALAAALTLVAGCPDAHLASEDAACSEPVFLCAASCADADGVPSVCVSGTRTCPAGTIDLRTCSEACAGAPPYPGCACVLGAWTCDPIACPPRVDPRDPDAPANRCDFAPARCLQPAGTCEPVAECTCEAGAWRCDVVEPDPVCTCGREPAAGELCLTEGDTCGECCPTEAGTGWAFMTCRGHVWVPGACDLALCPPLPCPADTAPVIGAACASEGQACGDPCCGTGIRCEDGRWARAPDAACACSAFACGPGTCRGGEACRDRCGPADGREHACVPLPAGCSDCDCFAPPPGYECTEVDGHVFVRELGLCG